MTTTENGSDPRSLGQLVASISEDMSTLVRGEIELAKAEMRESAKQAGAGAGLLVAAGTVAFLALVMLLIAGAYGIVAAGLPTWAGFLIVGGVLILLTGILGALGKSRFDKVKGPDRAKQQKDATRDLLQSIPERFSHPGADTAAAGSAPSPASSPASGSAAAAP